MTKIGKQKGWYAKRPVDFLKDQCREVVKQLGNEQNTKLKNLNLGRKRVKASGRAESTETKITCKRSCLQLSQLI